jgi:hypothetical protein
MNFSAFIISLVMGIIFIYLEVEWMGLAFIALSVIFFIYDPLKSKSKQAWEEMAKAETTSPDAKMDAYVKGFSKTLAENVVKTEETQVNIHGVVHKTPQMAKNFFSELKELLGLK